MEERNLDNLLKILSNKEAQKAIESLSKIDKDEWVSMAEVSTGIAAVVRSGGITPAFGSMFTRIETNIKLQIDSLFSELTNTVNSAITDIVVNPLMEFLNPVINDLDAFLIANKTGAGVGGIAGSIASLFLPGGDFWLYIGAAIGAAIEAAIKFIFTPPTNPPREKTFEELFMDWIIENPKGTLEEFTALYYGTGPPPYIDPYPGIPHKMPGE